MTHYVIVKDSLEQFRDQGFWRITAYCANNRMIRLGWGGCTELTEGVEIWRVHPHCSELVKTWRKPQNEYIRVR